MDEAFIKKIQPNSMEAEQSVIGAMIMDRDAIADVSDIVTKEDFYQKQNGILFESMTELYKEGKPVDLVTLQNKLKEKDVPEGLLSRKGRGSADPGKDGKRRVRTFAGSQRP